MFITTTCYLEHLAINKNKIKKKDNYYGFEELEIVQNNFPKECVVMTSCTTEDGDVRILLYKINIPKKRSGRS
jgi:hypothetical protein